MEYVGNLCNPCPLRTYVHEQPKGEFIIVSSAQDYLCTYAYTFTIRRKCL